MPQTFKNLIVETSDRIATITVNRPDKLNALNATTIAELERAFRAAAADEQVGGIILTGAGEKAFVAGADIGELARMGPIDGVGVSRLGQEAFRFLGTMGKP